MKCVCTSQSPETSSITSKAYNIIFSGLIYYYRFYAGYISYMCVTNLVLETNAFAQRGTSSLEVISNINIRPAVINVVDPPQYSFYKGHRRVHVKMVKIVKISCI